jgi:hypothetical protein
MSETPTPATEQSTPPATGTTAGDGGGSSSFPVRLAYAVYGALSADLGCLIGAIVFVLLIAASAYFAPQLTPCTSAGGIPCAP